MPLQKSIDTARAAHEALRRRAPGKSSDHESLVQLNQVRQCFDALWGLTREHAQGAHLRQAIRRLTADAEFYAGVGEAEGFRDAASVGKEYDFLQKTLVEPPRSQRDSEGGGAATS